jgi:hypothetical protein
MRAILTIVLQILVDSDHLDEMRGFLRCIHGEEPVISHSEAELFDQLKRLIAESRSRLVILYDRFARRGPRKTVIQFK